MAGSIFISLCDDVFPRIKRASELRTRLRDELTDEIVVTDSDMEDFEIYFKDFMAEFKNETASFGTMKDLGGQFSYKFTSEEQEGGMDELKALLERLCAENLLYRWYDDLGIGDLRKDAWVKYDALRDEWLFNNAQSKVVTPKYRPYW